MEDIYLMHQHVYEITFIGYAQGPKKTFKSSFWTNFCFFRNILSIFAKYANLNKIYLKDQKDIFKCSFI